MHVILTDGTTVTVSRVDMARWLEDWEIHYRADVLLNTGAVVNVQPGDWVEFEGAQWFVDRVNEETRGSEWRTELVMSRRRRAAR